MSYYNQNPEIRRNANALTRRNIGRILLMYLAMIGITMAVFVVFAVIASLTCLPAIFEAIDDLSYYSGRYYYSSYTIFDFLDVEKIIPGIIVLVAMLPILGLLTMGLSLGVTNGMIRMARGEQVSAGVVFSRMKNCFTGLGLSWWLSVKLSLWMLPALIPIAIGALLTAAIQHPAPMIIGAVAGYIVMFVCIIMASYRYAMATYFVADEPKTGTFGSVERSKAMMNGRKFQLFKLTFPYALISIAISLVITLINLLLAYVLPYDLQWIGTIIGLLLSVVSLVVSIYISMLTTMAQACFYTTHCSELASADYPPLYRLTMHNRQIRKHSVTTVNMNVGKVLAIDLINGLINGALYGVVMLVIALIGAILSGLMRDSSTAVIGGIIVFIVTLVLILAWVMVSIGLSLGRVNAHIKMARGEIVPITTLFSRMRNCFGGLGLSLWVGLKTFLWALPGAAAFGIGMGISIASSSNYYDPNVVGIALGSILGVIGYILMIVLTIRAAFSYMLSTYAYADKPENGVFNAVEQSVWMMHGSKLQMFRLQWPFIFLAEGVLLVLALIAGLGFALHMAIGTILTFIAVIVLIVAIMYISFLSNMSTACFYTKYNRWDAAEAKARTAAAQAQQAWTVPVPQQSNDPYNY